MSDVKLAPVSLKSLLVPSKTTEVEYPGLPGFKISLSFLSRETLIALRKKATTHSYKNRVQLEDFDQDLFLQLYVQEAIKGWTGLKLSYLSTLAPMELGNHDPESELAFDTDNALLLMKASTNFDGFVTEMVTDLSNFQNSNNKK